MKSGGYLPALTVSLLGRGLLLFKEHMQDDI